MFENLYKKVDSKVQPSEELINEIKQKMCAELNNSSKVRYINFYKYATIAACFIIFIGVLSVDSTKDIVMNEASSMNESLNDSSKETTGSNFGGNPFNSAFDSVTTSDAVTVSSAKKSFLDNIVQFFENIVQWFKELLF